MIKIKGNSSVVLLLVISCLLTISTQSVGSLQKQFLPSWSNFKKSNTNFTLSNPLNKAEIVFNIPLSQVTPVSIQIAQQAYWKSFYTSKSAQINLVSRGQSVFIEIHRLGDSKIQFTIDIKNENLKENVNVFDSSSEGKLDSNSVNGCDNNAKQILKGRMNCIFTNSKTIYIQYDSTGQKASNILALKKIISSKSLSNVTSLLQNLNIAKNPSYPTEQFARQMLTHTLSSLCVEESEYQGYKFYGLCSNSNPKEIDRHYSLLVIDILFKYNTELSAWLTENFIDLLEEKLFYSFSGREWIPVPEHIEVFVIYLRNLQKNKALSQTEIRKKINKVIQIQNGLINNLLLSEVNHLSEQINYRQNNKVHPTILKMLTQAWKTDFPRARVSSIYSESFTNDFYYHQQNEKLDSSVGKMVWLIKLINQHISVIKAWGDSYQKESMEQLLSLVKVMYGFVLDDPRAQNGDFHSVIQAQSMRLYTRSVGYESLLPFAYQISPVFPTTSMLNLTTSTGLGSMPQAHEKTKQTYNFRGNINLYFNYKILFNMIQRCAENSKLKVFYPGLKTVIESIQKLITASYGEANQNQNSKFYTSWTAQGKGVGSENYLAVINLAFLEEVKTLPEKTPQIKERRNKQQNKQATK